jgi:hypothetical protein
MEVTLDLYLTEEQKMQLIQTLGTEEGVEQLLEYLDKGNKRQQQTVMSSKLSFIRWLESIGLSIIANKLSNLPWQQIWDNVIVYLCKIIENINM